MAWLLPPVRDIGVLKAPIRSTLVLVGLFVLVVLAFGLLERLGLDAGLAPVGVLLASVMLFIVAALLSHSRRAVDFYVADRKATATFSGLAGAGGLTGLLTIGLAGGAFGSYREFLVAALGLVAGALVLAMAIAPGLRRISAYSAGDYIGARFGGPWVRLAWAGLAFTVSMLLLVAHLKVSAALFATVIGLTPATALYAVAGVTALAVLPGGMRSVGWTQAIQYLVVLIACLVPAGSLILRGTAGDVALASDVAALLADTVPDWGSREAASGTVLPFLLAALGAAALPHLIARALTAASPRSACLSLIWSAAFTLILAAVALVLGLLLSETADWSGTAGPLPIAALFISLPAVLAGLVLAGAVAALFAVGVATLFSATAALTHDIWDEIIDRKGPEGRRIIIARVVLVVVAAAATALTPILKVEPAALLRWALAISAAGGLAPLVVGLWWRRAIDIGAIAGMVAGFGFAGLAFVLSESGLFGGADAGGIAAIGAAAAAIAGCLVAFTVTIGMSLVLPAPEPDAVAEDEPAPGPDTAPIRERPA